MDCVLYIAFLGLLFVALVCCRASRSLTLNLDQASLAPYINRSLEVKLDSSIELMCPNLTEKVGIYHLFEDQYNNCLLPKERNYKIGDCVSGQSIHLIINSLSAPLDNLPKYAEGGTYYYGLFSSDGNSNDTCIEGLKFKVFIIDPNAPKPSSTVWPSSTVGSASTLTTAHTDSVSEAIASLLLSADTLGSGYTTSSSRAVISTTTSVAGRTSATTDLAPRISTTPTSTMISSSSSLRHLNFVTITFLAVSIVLLLSL